MARDERKIIGLHLTGVLTRYEQIRIMPRTQGYVATGNTPPFSGLFRSESGSVPMGSIAYFTWKESFSKSLSADDEPTMTMNSPGSTILFILMS